ncbi:unnamed protein product [Orchesella dallaii]|uniref:Uncharacterized protein n=1 Tax=Orchesella dallaii TaxID=48710 RepID=A0ABP1QH87_9HEXA
MEVIRIPSVLKNILRNLETSFIAHTCRLVNSDWNHESCSILQDRIPINFTTYDQLVRFTNIFETFNEGTSITFNSFRFSSDLFASAIQDRAFGTLKRLNNALDRCVTIWGEKVTNLEVTLYPIYPLEDDALHTSTVLMYEHLIKMLYSSFPNIMHLKILFLISNSQAVPEDFDVNAFMEPYSQLVLPKIERLTIEVAAREDGNTESLSESENIIITFMKVILASAVHLKSFTSSNVPLGKEKIVQDCIFNNFSQISPSLRELNVLLHVKTDEDMQIFSKGLPNLQHVQLEIDSSNVTPETLRDFFSHHSKSLRTLSLRFLDAIHSSLVYPILPLGVCLGQLSNLCLEQYNGSLNFRHLPNLDSLTLKHSKLKGIFSSMRLHQHNTNVLSGGNESVKLSIKELTIGAGCKIQNDNGMGISSAQEFLATVIPCFDNLSSLKVSNFVLPLPLIFRHCTKLKVLSILKCDGVTDIVLSGNSRTLLEAMSLMDFGKMDELFMEEGESLHAVKPEVNEFIKSLNSRSGFKDEAFVGCLKDLQFLEIEGEISDKAVLYGIMQCERLKTLKLHTNLISWRGQRIIQCTLKDLVKFEVFVRRNK